jgi:hypothetical protein
MYNTQPKRMRNGLQDVSNAFKLFSAAGYAGAFARVEPAIPALHHAWDTTTLTPQESCRVSMEYVNKTLKPIYT